MEEVKEKDDSGHRDFVCGINVKADSPQHAKDLYILEERINQFSYEDLTCQYQYLPHWGPMFGVMIVCLFLGALFR